MLLDCVGTMSLYVIICYYMLSCVTVHDLYLVHRHESQRVHTIRGINCLFNLLSYQIQRCRVGVRHHISIRLFCIKFIAPLHIFNFNIGNTIYHQAFHIYIQFKRLFVLGTILFQSRSNLCGCSMSGESLWRHGVLHRFAGML